MSKNRIKAFTMTELLVSTALAGLVMAGAMTIYGNLQRKEIEASLQSEFRSLSKQIEQGILRDIQNAERFDSDSVQMIGISEQPEAHSDVFGILLRDSQFSSAKIFDVSEAVAEEDVGSVEPAELSDLSPKASLTVQGDFRPLKEIGMDFLILRRGDESALRLREGGITLDRGYSTFSLSSGLPAGWNPADRMNPIKLYRVVLTYYRIGNGKLMSGLFRSQGKRWSEIKETPSAWQQISNRVDSMQVRYWFSDINGPAEADCLESTISGSRNPLLAGTSCRWENLTSMRIEFSLKSDQEIFSMTEHPHKAEKSKRLKHLHLISSAPRAESLD